MKINMIDECFINIFDEEMTKCGFLRKGNVYYKLNGEILQGVSIKSNISIHVYFSFYPYWMHFMVNNEKFSSFASNKWTFKYPIMPGTMEAPGYCDSEAVIRDQFEIFRQRVLPLLDIIHDNESFIRVHKMTSHENELLFYERDQKLVGFGPFIPEYSLLMKAWTEQSFDGAQKDMQDFIINQEDIYKNIGQDKSFDYIGFAPGTTYKDFVADIVKTHFSKFIECYKANDLEWIHSVYLDESERVKKALRRSFKLEID